MPARLTDSAIAKAIRETPAKGRRDLSDAALPGLRLRLTAAGAASWVLACRDPGGRMRRFPLGLWPDMGLSAAREAARVLRVEVRRGADPVADARRQRQQGRDARSGVGTLTALLTHYGNKVAAGQRSWPLSKRRIELVFKALLPRAVSGLARMDLQAAADGYPAPQQAGGALAGLRVVLRWAASRGEVPPDLLLLRLPAAKVQRDRVLTRNELAALLPALGALGGHSGAARFMLLTLARREEVCNAKWGDVDMDAGTWRIGSDRAKNGMTHLVPLSRQAVALLRRIGPGAADALVFASSKGGHLSNWDRATKAIMEASGTAGWTRHDLRRTGATMLGDMGETPDIIEAALNHVAIRSPIAATYNRSRYRPQVAAALQRLADALDVISAPPGAGPGIGIGVIGG